jgi:phage-related minor tail protein
MPDTAEIDKIKSQYAHIADGMTTAITEQNTIRDSWSTGWTNAFKTYVDDATNAAKLAQSAFNVFTNNITNAIDTFVKTGKFNFKSFATSIITELLAMEMKMQAMKLFSMLSGPGGTFAHIISSIFGFADGGDPPVGKASLVGENGPELFVPKQAGTIIPNSALGGQQPITNVTNNTYNINAIDAQSVAQFFAANRRLAYAAVTTAQNEMPYNNSRY